MFQIFQIVSSQYNISAEQYTAREDLPVEDHLVMAVRDAFVDTVDQYPVIPPQGVYYSR